jgi:hypothetical protein
MTGGRSGFISDPVIDTGRRQIMYAHCVAPNKVFVPAGPATSFRTCFRTGRRMGWKVVEEAWEEDPLHILAPF